MGADVSPDGRERGPACCPGGKRPSPGCKRGYLWSLFFVSVITFYGPGCKPQPGPVPLIEGGAQSPHPPPRLLFLHTQQDASASHKGLGRSGFVVRILTLEHENNYV